MGQHQPGRRGRARWQQPGHFATAWVLANPIVTGVIALMLQKAKAELKVK